MGWVDAFDSVNPQKAPWGPQGPTGPPAADKRFAEIPSDPPRILLTATVAEVQVVESGIVSVDQVCMTWGGSCIRKMLKDKSKDACTWVSVAVEEQTYELGQSVRTCASWNTKISPYSTQLIFMPADRKPGSGWTWCQVSGEGPQLAVVPAIGNAIHDAVGIRLTRAIHARQGPPCTAGVTPASNPCQTYWPKGTQRCSICPLFSWKDPTRCGICLVWPMPCDTRIIAGGTDLLPNLKHRIERPG